MVYPINKELIQKRIKEKIVDGKTLKVLEQEPGVLERYLELKEVRKRRFPHLGISYRFRKRLEVIQSHLSKNYPEYIFRVVTNKGSYIDLKTEKEEPEFWQAKKDKRTWTGIYPNRFKFSDIDLNVYDSNNKLLAGEEIVELFKDDPFKLAQTPAALLQFEDPLKVNPYIRFDFYPDKGEEGWFLDLD